MFWEHNRVGAWGRRMGCRSVGICDDAELPDSGKNRIIRDRNSAPSLGTSPASSQIGCDLTEEYRCDDATIKDGNSVKSR